MTTPKSLDLLEQQRVNVTNQIALSAICVVDRSLPPLADVANPTAIAISPRIQVCFRSTSKLLGWNR